MMKKWGSVRGYSIYYKNIDLSNSKATVIITVNTKKAVIELPSERIVENSGFNGDSLKLLKKIISKNKEMILEDMLEV